MRLTDRPTWQSLDAHARGMADIRILDLFKHDPQRALGFSIKSCGILLDYSKNPISAETRRLLVALAEDANVPAQIAAMFEGRRINVTEKRAVLHVALRNRSQRPVMVDGQDVMPGIRAVLERMRGMAERIRGGIARGCTGRAFTDIVNIGIGGSDLGPLMVTTALRPYGSPGLRAHFVSNVDGAHLAATLAGLDPQTTLFIVSSKTFTTQETLTNARSAREWLLTKLSELAPAEMLVEHHFAAVSTNLEATAEFGIIPEHVFGFWDWVGGRYSLWSAIGLPLALAVGFDNFRKLLAGAHAMDEHFFAAPPAENLPGLLALLEIWNSNFLGADNRALLPYSQSLGLLPRYLQQLEMESNGKQTDRQGLPMQCATAPILWGEAGTNGQHAFYQLIHQGGRLIPCEFIACKTPDFALPGHHEKLLANCFAQSEALMRGKTLAETTAELAAGGMAPNRVALLAPYRSFPGNQPSTTLLLPRLDPHTLGALLALYEHKVFVQSVIWDINPFDQWGVEYGKQLASRLLPIIEGRTAASGLDSSTAGLIDACKP